MSAKKLGWDNFFEAQLKTSDLSLIRARVSRQNTDNLVLLSEIGELSGVLPGKFRGKNKEDLPTVGDWVLARKLEHFEENRVLIVRVLTRRNVLVRTEIGQEKRRQLMAANVDRVFIVSGLDKEFNPKKIERYLLLCWSLGLEPVIVLNKADLIQKPESALKKAGAIAGEVPILVLSALTGMGEKSFLSHFKAGSTNIFLGSSGVGKSSISNMILGRENFLTGPVREKDSKGRHTTSHRELILTDHNFVIIDTPGIRGLQILKENISLDAFQDILNLAKNCKFRDCAHISEPDCALKQAEDEGLISSQRLSQFKVLSNLRSIP